MFFLRQSLLKRCILGMVLLMVAFGSLGSAIPQVFAQTLPPPLPIPGVKPDPSKWSQPNVSDTYEDQKVDELSCSLWSMALEGLRGCIAMVANQIMGIAAMFLQWAGYAFNWAITETVVRMGRNVDGLIGLTKAWEVIRDFGNLIFVFALVLIGIATILRAGSYHYKNLLKSVIIGALLINFSLVIGKVIIDASNILATEIYRSLMAGAPQCSPQNLETPAGRQECANNGLSGLITARLQITSIYDASRAQGIFGAQIEEGEGGSGLTVMMKIILIAAGGTVLIAITTIVIFGGTIMLVIRYVVLLFLLVFSPIAFAGMALPYTQKYAKMWWNKLLSQAFFAPAYLLMIYISVAVMSTPLVDGAVQGSFSQALLNSQGASGIIFMFMLVIGLMVLSLIVARDIGAYGASGTLGVVKGFKNSIVGGLTGAAGGATFGAAARLGRATLGRDAYNDNERAELLARAGGKGAGAYMARIRLRSNDYLSTASFDARRAGSAGKALQNLGFGKGKEGGFKKQVEEQKKRYEARAKQIGNEDALTEEQKEQMDIEMTGRRAAETEIGRLSKLMVNAEKRGESPEVYGEEISRLKGEVKRYDAVIDKITRDAKNAGKARKAEYGRSIQDEKFMAFLTGTSEARAQTATALRKDKSTLKELDELMKKYAKENAEAPPPPPAAPPAGGTS